MALLNTTASAIITPVETSSQIITFNSSTTTAAIPTATETPTVFHFCGDVIINQFDEEEAIRIAAETSASSFDPNHRIIFVASGSADIAKCKNKKQKQSAHGSRIRASGAAVVCKADDEIWKTNSFGLGQSIRSGTSRNIDAGFYAIAEALALVATQVACDEHDNAVPITKPTKVTIFSRDNRTVMSEIDRLRIVDLTTEQLECTERPGLKKLITTSQYLRRIGVDVEVRWSPRRRCTLGNKLAESVARKAAISFGACKSDYDLDEELQTLVDSLC